MPLKVVEIGHVGGGVNDYERPHNIAANQMQNTSRNIRGIAGSYSQRGGYTTLADELTSGGIRNLGAYYRKADADDRLIAIQNAKIYKIDPSTETTWTEITQALLTDTVDVDLFSYRDSLYVLNGVDKPVRVENTTVTQDIIPPASVGAASFLPAFGDVYGASLFVAGVPTKPNVVFVSKASTTANPEFAYDFSGALVSYGDANEIILQNRVTAIKKLSTAVVIFTNNEAIYIPGLKEFGTSVTFEVQPIGGASGAVSQKSTTVVENDIYYLTPKKEIKSIKRGFSDSLSVMTTSLSTSIQQFLNKEVDDDLSSAWAYYDETNKLYKLHLRPKGGTVNQITIVGDLDKVDQMGVPTWYIDDSRPFNSGIYYKGQSYVASGQIGQAYNDEVGTADNDDADVTTLRVSKDFVANNPTAVKNYRQVVLYGEMTISTVISVRVYVDNLLTCEATITADDLPEQGSVQQGGIAVDEIASFAIADDGEESETGGPPSKLEFTKRLNIRQTGKKMRIETSTEGTTNDYNIRYMEYAFLAKTYLYNPIIEK